ncbi:MAG: GAF domain-containing protein [Anaerolineaceae bacterium]|nr:GAF domain-containing protein [Anaerolineaceae bacterium]
MAEHIDQKKEIALRDEIERLTASDRRHRELFDSLPLGLFQSTIDGRILKANPAMVELLGYPSTESFIDVNINSLYFNSDLILPQLMLTLQRTQRIDHVDIRMIRRDQSIIWVSLSLILLYGDSGEFVVQGIVQDVTPRKLSERALKESEVLYQSVVMALMEGVLVCDENDIVLACNPRAEQILHQPEIQIIGKRPLQNLHAYRENGDYFPYEEYPSVVALHTGKPCLNVIIQVELFDGMKIWVQINSQPLFYPGESTPYGVVSSFQDISPRITTQAQLQRQVEELQLLNAVADAGAEATDEIPFLIQAQRWARENFLPARLDLLLLDERTGILSGVEVGENREPINVRLGRGLIGMVTVDGLSRYVEIIDQEGARYSPLYTSTRSQLCVPIKAEGKVLGVINLESSETRAFGVDTENIMNVLAGQIATAVLKIRSFNKEHVRRQQLEMLVSISRSMRRARRSDEILAILVDRTLEVLNASRLLLVLAEDNFLNVVWNHGLDPVIFGQQIPANTDDPYWQVMQNRQMTYLPTTGRKPDSFNPVITEVLEQSTWSVVMPLKAANTMLGLMHIGFNDDRGSLSRSEREMLTTIAEIAGISLHRAQVTETLEQRVAERTRSLSAMYNIGKVSAEMLDMQELIERSLNEILKAMDTDVGAVYLLEESQDKKLVMSKSSGVPSQVAEDMRGLEIENQVRWEDWMVRDPRVMSVKDMLKRPRVPESIERAGLRTFLAVPLRSKGELMGVIAVFSRLEDAFSQEDVELLIAVSNQMADAVDTARLRIQAKDATIMAERQRLARELHDSVTQSLYSLNLMVNAAKRFAKTGNTERAEHYLNELTDISQQALKEMRLLIYDLRPAALEEEGLYAALTQRLETVERRAGVKTTIHGDFSLTLPSEIEEGLYRIAIEALNNILKHATATEAEVRIERGTDYILLDVEDNGKGIDPSKGAITEGIGMKSMRERAAHLGGKLEIFSKQGNGTIIRAVIPLKEKESRES